MMRIALDLQLFAEKTEKATPKRRRDAREQGQVLRSVEVNSAFVLLASFLGLKLTGPNAVNELKRIYTIFLNGSRLTDEALTTAFLNITVDLMISFIRVTAPLCLVILIAGVAVNYLQVGFLFTTKPLGFKFSRLNPLEGFKRMFSLQGLVQLLKAMIKVVIIGYTTYKAFSKILLKIPGLAGQNILSQISFVVDGVFDIAFSSCIAFAIFSVLDYLYQWWEYEKGLMMTKEEIKEEFKQMEGDPKIKGKIKEKQRQMAMSRMMQQVPRADVVITNPTHFAVALLYEEAKNKAPIVIAKGQDYVALRIIKIARENNVQVVENKPLARTLYQSTEIGEEIPVELYRAVAEILAYVYRMKNKR